MLRQNRKKVYFTHIKGTNIRNIFPVLMFQQLLRVNIIGCVIQSTEHDLAEWRSASGPADIKKKIIIKKKQW